MTDLEVVEDSETVKKRGGVQIGVEKMDEKQKRYVFEEFKEEKRLTKRKAI